MQYICQYIKDIFVTAIMWKSQDPIQNKSTSVIAWWRL